MRIRFSVALLAGSTLLSASCGTRHWNGQAINGSKPTMAVAAAAPVPAGSSPLSVINGHALAMAFATDDTTFTYYDFDGNLLKVCSVATGAVVHSTHVDVPDILRNTQVLSDDGSTLAFTTRPSWVKVGKNYLYKNRAIYLWDVATGKVKLRIPIADDTETKLLQLCTLRLSPNGSIIVTQQDFRLPQPDGGYLPAYQDCAWDARSGEQIWKLDESSTACFQSDPLRFSADGKSLVTVIYQSTGSGDTTENTARLVLLDARSGVVRQTISELSTKVPMHLWKFLNISKDGSQVAAIDGMSSAYIPMQGDYEETISIWQAATSKLMQTLKYKGYTTRKIFFLPDGKHLLGGTETSVGGPFSGNMEIWNVSTGQIDVILDARDDFDPPEIRPNTLMALSESGRLVADSDGAKIEIWRVPSI